jgi:hypothetical protein
MDIEFFWDDQVHINNKSTVEEEICNIIRDIKPCHAGAVSVYIAYGDPIETTITVAVKCSKGHAITSFNCPPNFAWMTPVGKNNVA